MKKDIRKARNYVKDLARMETSSVIPAPRLDAWIARNKGAVEKAENFLRDAKIPPSAQRELAEALAEIKTVFARSVFAAVKIRMKVPDLMKLTLEPDPRHRMWQVCVMELKEDMGAMIRLYNGKKLNIGGVRVTAARLG